MATTQIPTRSCEITSSEAESVWSTSGEEDAERLEAVLEGVYSCSPSVQVVGFGSSREKLYLSSIKRSEKAKKNVSCESPRNCRNIYTLLKIFILFLDNDSSAVSEMSSAGCTGSEGCGTTTETSEEDEEFEKNDVNIKDKETPIGVDEEAEALLGLDEDAEAIVGVDKGTETLVGLDKGAETPMAVDKRAEVLVGVDKGAATLMAVDKGAEILVGVDEGVEVPMAVDKGAETPMIVHGGGHRGSHDCEHGRRCRGQGNRGRRRGQSG